jgi:integrase
MDAVSRAEIAALRWSDIDFAHRRLQVTTTLSGEGNRAYALLPTAKSEASEGRIIPLPRQALDALMPRSGGTRPAPSHETLGRVRPGRSLSRGHAAAREQGFAAVSGHLRAPGSA